jgi:endonuclease V-like protein UPF0215 family
MSDAEKIIEINYTYSSIPEHLRFAQIIASGFTKSIG